MTSAGSRLEGTATYRVVLAGHLDDHWSDWLGDVTLVRHDDRTTTVTIAAADQAQLHGLLVAVRDIGATLVSVEREGATPRSG